jgi:hypothetical protein
MTPIDAAALALFHPALSPVQCSLGGVPYNSEHIEYWKQRALAAEARSRDVKQLNAVERPEGS